MSGTSMRDVYRVVAARFLSRAGSEAAFFIGVWGKAAYVLDATASQLAIVMFALSVASILGSINAGVLIDRFGPRRVLMAAEVLFVPAAIAMIWVDTLPQLTVMVAIWGFVGAPVMTAGASFAPFLAHEGIRLEKINAWIEGAGSLSFAVGPAIGAILVTYVSVDWIFALDAATSLVAALLVARVALPPLIHEGKTGKRGAFAQLTEGTRIVYGMRSLRYYVLAGSLVWLAFGAFGALEPLFFRDVVGTGVQTIGWMNSLFGLGFMTGAALLPRLPRKLISARGLAVAVCLTGLGTVLYVGSPDLRVIAVGAYVWAVFIGFMEPMLRTLMHRDAPPYAVGRVMGISEVHRRAGEVLPLAFAPALAAAFGVQAVLIGGGLFASAVALLSLGEARAIDRERPPREDVELQGLRMADEPISPNA